MIGRSRNSSSVSECVKKRKAVEATDVVIMTNTHLLLRRRAEDAEDAVQCVQLRLAGEERREQAELRDDGGDGPDVDRRRVGGGAQQDLRGA
jgi:hypothetical protein